MTIIKKIHQVTLYVFVFLLPWQIIYIIREFFFDNEKWQYGTIGIYIFDIIILLWIFLSLPLYRTLIYEQMRKQKWLLISALTLILWTVISLFWSPDIAITIYGIVTLLLAFIIFFFTQAIPFNIFILSLIFVFSIALHSIIGLIQFTTQTMPAQKLLGIAYHDVWSGGNAIITTDSERWLRAYAGLPHPNIFGSLLVCAILLAITLYMINKHPSKLLKVALLSSIGLMSINLLFTFSRTSWIAMLIGIIALFFIITSSKKNPVSKLLPPLVLMASMSLCIIILFSSVFFVRITHDSVTTHNSISDRKLYMMHAFDQISTHPITGTSLATYTKSVFLTHNQELPIWHYQPVHNIYILILSELGIIGALCFLAILIFFITTIFQQKDTLTLLNKTYLLIIILLLIIGFFDHWLWTMHFGILLFALFAALSLPKQKMIQS